MPLGIGVMGWSSAIVDIVGCDDRCPDKHCEERDDFCRGWERALDDPCVDEGKDGANCSMALAAALSRLG